MGRFYSIPFSAVAVTAAQDLWEVLAGSGKPFWLHEITVGQYTDYGDAAAEGLSIIIKRATGSYTSGSGGTTPTIGKHLTNDATAGVTAEVNNTTVAAAGSGSLITLRPDAFNIQGGFQYMPPPEQRYLFLPTEACIVTITAPTDSLTMNGTMVIEEL